MQCKNCGANYKTRELVCPYCETENLIGKLWKAKRTEAELEYEAERKALGRKYSIYVVDRVLNRALLIGALLFVIIVAGISVTFFVQDKVENYRNKVKKDEIIKTLDEYYTDERFREMDNYMEDKGIYGEAYYPYTQITLINYSYEEYLTSKYIYLDMTYEEKLEDDYEIKCAIRYALDVYTMNFGVLSEIDKKNEKIYNEYCKEIESFLITVVGFEDEDFEYVTSEDTRYISETDLKRYVEKAKERLDYYE